jgi:hypothetical protein
MNELTSSYILQKWPSIIAASPQQKTYFVKQILHMKIYWK